MLLILNRAHEAISKEKLTSPISLIGFLNSMKLFQREKEKHVEVKRHRNQNKTQNTLLNILHIASKDLSLNQAYRTSLYNPM